MPSSICSTHQLIKRGCRAVGAAALGGHSRRRRRGALAGGGGRRPVVLRQHGRTTAAMRWVGAAPWGSAGRLRRAQKQMERMLAERGAEQRSGVVGASTAQSADPAAAGSSPSLCIFVCGVHAAPGRPETLLLRSCRPATELQVDRGSPGTAASRAPPANPLTLPAVPCSSGLAWRSSQQSWRYKRRPAGPGRPAPAAPPVLPPRARGLLTRRRRGCRAVPAAGAA